MLPKSALVKTRAVLESFYSDSCDIIQREKSTNAYHQVEYRSVTTNSGIPCKVSKKEITSSIPSGNGTFETDLQIVLFISPDIEIKENSKIEVKSGENKGLYVMSGAPRKYPTHQEIGLKLYDGRA